MTKPPYPLTAYAAVLVRMVAADLPVTAMEIGRDTGLYPLGTAQ